MKKFQLILTAVLLFQITISFAQEPKDDILITSRKLGLVAYLTEVKYISEFQMSKLIENPQYKVETEKVKEFNQTYNALKIYVDMFINQMAADLNNKNRLRLYRRADKYIKSGKAFPQKYKQYEDCLKNIEALSTSLGFKTYSSKAGASFADWIDLGSLALDVVKMNQETRQKKVEKITAIISQLRLKDTKDLKVKKE
uniref:hypothetical protein n=1 Tax=Flavobacterium sp. TaxID=239 RepID=UPI00404B6C57